MIRVHETVRLNVSVGGTIQFYLPWVRRLVPNYQFLPHILCQGRHLVHLKFTATLVADVTLICSGDETNFAPMLPCKRRMEPRSA